VSVLTQPLTASRARHIRLHLALIPLYVWVLFTWTGYARSVATPGALDEAGLIKGHDFVHFYVLGQIALEHQPGELYDYGAQAKRTDRLAGYEDRYLPAYGPQVALLFAPLAKLPYGRAWAVWACLSALVYGLSWYAVWRSEPGLREYRWPAFVAALGYPPFAMLIGFGHISSLAAAAFAGTYLALRAGRPWLAGVAIGCLFLKPPLAVLLPVVFVYARAWRVIAGAIVTVVVQLALAAAYFGGGVLQAYWRVTIGFGRVAADLEPQPHQMQSLRSLFSVLMPWPTVALVCYLVTASVAAFVAARCWRSAAPLPLRYAVLLVAAILVDPHVNVYDLVVLVPMFLIVAGYALRESAGWRLWALLGFCFYSPIFAHPVSAIFGVQIVVVGLAVLGGTLARMAYTASHPSKISRQFSSK